MLLMLAVVLVGCTSNMTFNTVEVVPSSDGHQIPRFETGAQGNAGDAASPPSSGVHRIERTTAGGSYLRRQDSASGQYRMTAGVHD